VLGQLASPAGPDDLAGEEAARRAFTRTVTRSARFRGPAAATGPRTPAWPAAVGRAAAALTAVAAIGTSIVAQAGVLPRPAQQLAHHVIGAPPARLSARAVVQRAGSKSLLCRAYQHARDEDQTSAVTAALRRMLTRAAGGAGAVGAYCAAAWSPVTPAGPDPSPAPPARPSSGTPSNGRTEPAGPGHDKGPGKSHGHGPGRGWPGRGHEFGNRQRNLPVHDPGNENGNSGSAGNGPDSSAGPGNRAGHGQGNRTGQGNGNGNGHGHGHGNR